MPFNLGSKARGGRQITASSPLGFESLTTTQTSPMPTRFVLSGDHPLDGSHGRDLLRSYMRDISRVPLLSAEQEITLGRQVQQLVALEEVREELTLRAGGIAPNDQQLAVAADLAIDELQARIRDGRQAKERMVSANLRLVVSIAKN